MAKLCFYILCYFADQQRYDTIAILENGFINKKKKLERLIWDLWKKILSHMKINVGRLKQKIK